MSCAFDTIRRQTILNLLEDAGCNKDEIRLVRFLLSNIKIRVKINNELSLEFESTTGAPQGDSLSGTCFTLTLAGAAYHLRAVTGRPTPPINANGMPEENEYSDDIDFLGEDKSILSSLLPVATKVFKEWSLNVNNTKTEFVHVYIATKHEKMADGKPLRGNEDWCTNKLLGSLLDSTKDINRRCVLGDLAFQTFKKVWLHQSKIPLKQKLHVYEALVVSVIMYNANSWAAPKAAMDRLDICHRKHLRYILNVKWPNSMMSNKTLYKRCSSTPLSERAVIARWKKLGHILRSEECTLAQSALCFAVEKLSITVGRVGHHRTNLMSVLKKDLAKRYLYVEDYEDIIHLRELASNRKYWGELYDFIAA